MVVSHILHSDYLRSLINLVFSISTMQHCRHLNICLNVYLDKVGLQRQKIKTQRPLYLPRRENSYLPLTLNYRPEKKTHCNKVFFYDKQTKGHSYTTSIRVRIHFIHCFKNSKIYLYSIFGVLGNDL